MTSTTTIEIDFEVYKLIEGERRSFDEPRLAALRRLLGLDDAAPAPPEKPETEGRAWRGDGVVLPHGTLLKMSYNDKTYEGKIVDGKWLVEGNTYHSPSGAAVGVARTRDGKRTHLNGKNYWYAKLPDSENWVLAQYAGKQESVSLEELGL